MAGKAAPTAAAGGKAAAAAGKTAPVAAAKAVAVVAGRVASTDAKGKAAAKPKVTPPAPLSANHAIRYTYL